MADERPPEQLKPLPYQPPVPSISEQRPTTLLNPQLYEVTDDEHQCEARPVPVPMTPNRGNNDRLVPACESGAHQ